VKTRKAIKASCEATHISGVDYEQPK